MLCQKQIIKYCQSTHTICTQLAFSIKIPSLYSLYPSKRGRRVNNPLSLYCSTIEDVSVTVGQKCLSRVEGALWRGVAQFWMFGWADAIWCNAASSISIGGPFKGSFQQHSTCQKPCTSVGGWGVSYTVYIPEKCNKNKFISMYFFSFIMFNPNWQTIEVSFPIMYPTTTLSNEANLAFSEEEEGKMQSLLPTVYTVQWVVSRYHHHQ